MSRGIAVGRIQHTAYRSREVHLCCLRIGCRPDRRLLGNHYSTDIIHSTINFHIVSLL